MSECYELEKRLLIVIFFFKFFIFDEDLLIFLNWVEVLGYMVIVGIVRLFGG